MCDCQGVEIGSYKNQVELKTPKHMLEKGNIGCLEFRPTTCIDKCLVEEIKHLWSLGITTTGCCCGHNKMDGYIGVAKEDIQKMKKLGYETQYNPFRPDAEDTFYPKSIERVKNNE